MTSPHRPKRARDDTPTSIDRGPLLKEGPLGVIVEGAYAEMIPVDGNPLEDISVLAKYDQNISSE